VDVDVDKGVDVYQYDNAL